MSTPLSLDTIIQRLIADEVVTRGELKRDAGRAAAKNDVGAYLAALDQYKGKMTATASDAYARAKTVLAADPANNQLAALQVLAKPELDQIPMPSWFPATFDFPAATRAIRDFLIVQGTSAESIDSGRVRKLLFEDADLTFLNTSTPTLLVKNGTENNEEPDFLRYPADAPEALRGRIILLGGRPDRDTKKELDELKAAYPSLDWASYKQDFREFGSISEILRTDIIPHDIERFKTSDRDPTSKDFVITARSAGPTWIYLDEKLRQKGVDVDGVLAVNTKRVTQDILQNANVSSAQKKALTIAAIIYAYGPEKIKNIEFRDDTDSNLMAAMELLPRLFPEIKMQFHDVIHAGENKFEDRLVAFTNGMSGELIDGQTMKRYATDALKAYVSGDAPFPIDPVFRPVTG